MRPYITLIERLTSGTSWDDGILTFWFDLGAMGVERYLNGELVFEKGIAIKGKAIVDWDITSIELSTAFYKLYTRKGHRLQEQEEMFRFIKGLDVLMHDHENLKTSAMHDSLTSALNRRGLEIWFEKRKRIGYGVGFVLACLDLDRFKELNDSEGHQRGDQALVEITQRLQMILRNTDVVARLGGDEFVFIIDQTPCHPGIRTRLEEIISQLPLDRYGLTATIGAACYPVHGVELASVIAMADAGLYKGKSDGRNRIVLWEEERLND